MAKCQGGNGPGKGRHDLWADLEARALIAKARPEDLRQRRIDWRNGLPLCATHYLAFDADLFANDPETLEIMLADGIDHDILGVLGKLATKRGRPHIDAIRRRFEQFNKKHSPGSNSEVTL
jgi:hypothetical protein